MATPAALPEPADAITCARGPTTLPAAHTPGALVRPVAHFPAVAVRAVQKVSAPPFAGAGDVGELIVDAGCDQDAAGCEHVASAKTQCESRLDLEHLIFDDLDAVALHFIPSGGDELER